MKCYQCDGEYREKRGRLQLTDPWIGAYSVDAAHYYKCKTCGDLLLPPETIAVLESERERILDRWVKSQPLDSFLSAAQTASLLGISRQALHKHRRIRRGFIYQTTFDGRIVYLRESVLLYRQTGDGRFPLPTSEYTISLPDAVYQTVQGSMVTSEMSSWTSKSSFGVNTPWVGFPDQQLAKIPQEDFHHA